MLVTIIYNKDFETEALSLRADILNEWPGCNINRMGIENDFVGAKYQIQLESKIIYKDIVPVDNTTIINSIKERL